ncbi:MAG: ABC transporter permease [Beijerinckiaceae bacterium]|nr:ABC transporter permease [Beijerinckiaceae bacterium]
MRRARLFLEQAALPLLIILSWEIAAAWQYAPRYLSSPSAVAHAFWRLLADGELLPAIATSLWRAYAGFFIGALLGALAGLCAGLLRGVRDFFDPLVAFFYPIPKIAFLPVVLLLFGLGDGSKIAIIALSVFFPMFIAARHSVAEIDRQMVWSARCMGAGNIYIFRRVILPATRPQLLAGARVGLSLAFVLLFAAELIGSKDGLGHLIHQGEEALRFDLMLAAIATFGLLGFFSDAMLMKLRARLLRGQMIGTQELAS